MTLVAGLVPVAEAAGDLDGDALRGWLAARYHLPGDRWLRLNLVTTLGGQITGPGGTSDDLTGGIDRVLLGVLRRSADAVLIGASSARREGRALPRTARLVVATLTGSLEPADLPDPQDGRRALVLCPAAEAGRLVRTLNGRAEVLAVPGAPAAEPGLLLAALAGEGLGRVVCEGGGGLASALIGAGAVDELDQTIAPLALSPGEPLLTGAFSPVTASLVGLLRDGTDRLYARWGLPRR